MGNQILTSWEENAAEWVNIIDREGIASRKTTNQAIVDAIVNYNHKNVCDIGCGEDWLTRKLNSDGIKTTGVDGTAQLIENARLKSQDEFSHLTYQQIIEGQRLEKREFEAVVFNFSLYEDELTYNLLNAIQSWLNHRSLLFIQTIHPFHFASDRHAYKSRWLNLYQKYKK